MCYKDKCFCSIWELCKKGKLCHRALTPLVDLKAGKLGLYVQSSDEWECFDRMPPRPKLEW